VRAAKLRATSGFPVCLVRVLAEAKRRGLVVAAKPHLDALRDVTGFWLSGDLRDLGEV
jgi:predicted nucleic acid-binding protein